jgi:hypothetical protein
MATEKDRQKLIATIEKLLRLSENSGATPAEKELAETLAAKMLAEYNISMVELNGSSNENMMAEKELKGFGDDRCGWEIALAKGCAHAFDCDYFTKRGYKTPGGENCYEGWTIVFMGHKADLALCEYFFIYIRRNISTMGRIAFPKRFSDRNEYQIGLKEGVVARLDNMFRKAQEFIPSDSMALVLSRRDAVQVYKKSAHPDLVIRNLNMGRRSNPEYRYQGREDAKKINLGRPVEGSNGHTAVNGAKRELA